MKTINAGKNSNKIYFNLYWNDRRCNYILYLHII